MSQLRERRGISGDYGRLSQADQAAEQQRTLLDGSDQFGSRAPDSSFPHPSRPPPNKLLRRAPLLALGVTVILIVVGLHSAFPQSLPVASVSEYATNYDWRSALGLTTTGFGGKNLGDHREKIQLVLPATKTSADLCRSLTSALLSGYEEPLLVNFGLDANHSHVAKISALHDYLRSGGYDDDVILTTDAYDVYFQAPADLLLSRFRRRPTDKAVFGADKRCVPMPDDAPRCQRLPQSELPADLYGDATDKIYEEGDKLSWIRPVGKDPANWVWGKYERMRPRFINSGTLMGTRKSLLTLYDASVALMNTPEMAALQAEAMANGQKVESDQLVFSIANLKGIEAGESLVDVDTTDHLFSAVAHKAKELKIESYTQMASEGAITEADKVALPKEEWSKKKFVYNGLTQQMSPVLHMAGTRQVLAAFWDGTWLGSAGDHFTDVLVSEAGQQKYGARLANGTWLSWQTLCGQFVE